MKKINELSAFRADYQLPNDLYTRFKDFFRTILPAEELRANTEKEKHLYINDYEFENEIELIKSEPRSSTTYVLGFAGTGKSTSLRHVFRFNASVPTIIDNSILVAPATFNGNVAMEDYNDINMTESDVDSEILTNFNIRKPDMPFHKWAVKELTILIRSYCSCLEDTYPHLRSILNSYNGQRQYYQFLRATAPKALERIGEDELRGLSDEQVIDAKLNYIYKKEPFVAAATKLKFYMSNELINCKRIILILDDIEPLSYECQHTLILMYSRLLTCLQNLPIEVSCKEFTSNLIIAMRPHTYRLVKELRDVKAFPHDPPVYKMNNISFSAYFEKRFNYYVQYVLKDKDKSRSWEEPYKILSLLVTKFEARYAELVKNIAIWNIRDMIGLFTTIMTNRAWIQKDMEKKYYFQIAGENYVFNNITVLRAIACGNQYVYRSNDNSIIPNLLKNTLDKDYSLLNLNIIRCFIANTSSKSVYGEDSLSIGDIIHDFNAALPGYTNLSEDLITCIKYLFITKVLRKSINDYDEIDTLDNPETLTEQSLLYLSPRGNELWTMLGSDSVYMELCREDYYRDSSNNSYTFLSSYELMKNNQQEEIFIDLYSLLDIFVSDEEKLVTYAIDNHSVVHYVHLFGSTSVCRQLLNGIHKSTSFSGKYYSSARINELQHAYEKRVENIERLLSE